jgi:hypothetical protein
LSSAQPVGAPFVSLKFALFFARKKRCSSDNADRSQQTYYCSSEVLHEDEAEI